MNDSPRLIVGSGGLLGSAVQRRLSGAQRAAVPWGTDEAGPALDAAARALMERAGDHTRPWGVLWCAGAGVNGTSQEALEREVAEFHAFLTSLVDAAGDRRGGLFLASSAGGVYAGSQHPPFTERHATAPLSPYGEAKLAMEEAARTAFAGTPHGLAVGRIANLYGPGQNLGKMQGLISHICRALATDQPLNLFVPIDTIRDYIYVDDAADMAIGMLDHVIDSDTRDVTKIMASGRGVTIGELIGLARVIAKRRPPVVYAASPLASYQSSDLRLRSVVLPELDDLVQTPLDAGLAATARAVNGLAHSGLLAR